MRILTVGNMYPPHYLGGHELVWEDWVEYARARGHAVRVLTTDLSTEWGRAAAPDGEHVSRSLRWYWSDHAFPRFGLRERLEIERHNGAVFDRELAEFRPDVVSWWAMAGMSMASIERVRRAGVPSAAVLCDYWLQYGPQVDGWARMFDGRPRLGRLAERLTGAISTGSITAPSRYVFLSDKLRRAALGRWPGLENVEVVGRGPDRDLFGRAAPAEWDWKLLYVGRIERVKGVDLAIRALVELPEQATLTIDGPGEDVAYRTELAGLVEELGLEGRVGFGRSPRSELGEVYANASAVLFPVRWQEPWGLVPLEAMSVGRPVVASGRGGSTEFLEDETNCLLFDPDRGAGELADRIRRLASDSGLRERLVAGGERTASELSAERFNERVLAATEAVAPERFAVGSGVPA